MIARRKLVIYDEVYAVMSDKRIMSCYLPLIHYTRVERDTTFLLTKG